MTATVPAQSKQGSSRSTSLLSPRGIGYSPPTPVSPATSGIPSLRSLRSLLPFGPNKNATPVSLSLSPPPPPTPNPSRSPFASFGTVRRSMTKERERKMSLSNDAVVTPVIAIEKDPFPDDFAIRRSVSLSTLEKALTTTPDKPLITLDKPLPAPDKPLPNEPGCEGSLRPFGDHLLPSAFTLRTPSPGPSLSAELSTIIEADNSGASKHITTNLAPIHSPLPTTPKVSLVNGNSYTAPKPSPSPSTSTPTTSRRNITLNHTTRLFSPSTTTTSPSSSSSFSASRTSKVFGKQPLPNGSAPNLATRTLRQVMLGVRPNTHDPVSPPTVTLGRASLDSRSVVLPTENGPIIGLGRPSFEISRGTSFFDSRTRPAFNRSSTSPERTETTTTTEADSSPSPDIPFQEYRPPFDTISRPNSTAPPRDWDGQRTTPSLRVVDTTITRDKIPRISTPQARTRKRSMSVQERFGRGRVSAASNELGASLIRPGSSLSAHASKPNRGNGAADNGNESSGNVSGPKMEWLGPRTAKAFRAAGLLDFERERGEESVEPTEKLFRDRSSSTSGVLSPSSSSSGGSGNPTSTLNRFASLRSASDYNPIHGRSHSRLALSEAGTGGSGAITRRESPSLYGCNGGGSGGGGGGGSSYGHNGLMESPTFTVSSGSRERDTLKSSTSTTATSLADSFGYLGRDNNNNRERERDHHHHHQREEIREMKERHGTEMGALLGALSDSQRTVKVLREENSDLRDRLEQLTLAVQANQELRQMFNDLQSDCTNLKRENTDLRRELVGLRVTNNNSLTHGWSGNGSGSRTPVPKTAANSSSPLARTFTTPSRVTQQGEEEEEYDKTFIDHGSQIENHLVHYPSNNKEHCTSRPSELTLPSSSSCSSSQKKRLSNSSSIFPIPPSNMTLLLHEDATSTLGSISSYNRSSTDHSQYSFSLPPPPAAVTVATSSKNASQRKTHVRSLSQSPPISYQNFAANVPSTSVGSISPTTTNFSMITGSPGSLFLRPEHEILLGDMESLDLGLQTVDGDGKVDDW